MKKILLTVGGVVGVLVVGVLGYASLQPDTYHVERNVTVAAAPADVYPYLNDYTKWAVWNPWGKLDPAMKSANSTNPVGVGAWTTWEGNNEVGSGKMTILESVPDERVKHEVHFLTPFEDTSVSTFSMKAVGDKTTVTWGMDGKMNLMSKTMGLFMSMEEMIAADFERGLTSLKPLAEADAQTRIAAEQAAAQKAAEEAAIAAGLAAVPADPIVSGGITK